MSSSNASRDQYDALWRDLWANTHAGGPMARTRYRLALQWLHLDPHSSARILDVGAGNGAFMAEALKATPGLAIFGSEFSQAAIDLAHPHIRTRLAPCDLQGEEPLPWGGNFQVVTCMEVLEHLPHDELALRHIAAALAPGGRVFISVPAWQSKWGPQDVTAGHVRRYEPQVLRERLECAGLRVKRIKCWGGLFARIYRHAIDLVGPEKVMSMQPTDSVGLAAAMIFQMLKLDDVSSFGRGEQLLALAEKPPVA
jgi:2-polyprenyl-3-methyl-5-hydroxy-6-metoxy-1,4-benzoquinol methylase